MISLSKLEMVRRYLLAELADEKYVAGSPFPSENELSNRLGICKNTVREALSGLVAEGRLVRSRGRGTFIGDATAAPGASRPKVLQLIVGDYLAEGETAFFVSSMLAGLHAELDRHDYQILVSCVPDSDRGINQLKYFPSGNCSAIVLAGFDFSPELVERIARSGIPAVTVGKSELGSLPCVYTDHRGGMRLAVEHLLNAGHRRIALVDSPHNHAASYFDRQEGFLEAMGAAGAVPDARLMISGGEHGRDVGADSCRKLLARNADFSAAIIYGESESYGFLREFERSGKRIPEDLSLISYASSFGLAPDLTTVSWDLCDLARAAARRLLADPPGEMFRPLPVILREGRSVRPCRDSVEAAGR